MGNFQVIDEIPRKSTLARAVEAAKMGMQGYQAEQNRRMKLQENSLSNMKTMAEMEKMSAEIPLLKAQSNLFNSYAGQFGGQNPAPVQYDNSGEDDLDQKIAELEAELQQATPNNAKRRRILSQDEDVLGLGF